MVLLGGMVMGARFLSNQMRILGLRGSFVLVVCLPYAHAHAAATSAAAGGWQPQYVYNNPYEDPWRHCPAMGMNIKWNGAVYSVQHSAPGNPVVALLSGSRRQQSMNWMREHYTILRTVTESANGECVRDQDLREGDMGANPPVQANRNRFHIRIKFEQGKNLALSLAKACLLRLSGAEQRVVDAEIVLTNFRPVQGREFATGWQEPAEWVYEWTAPNRRKWKLTIDSDRPLAESSQEPHVGWTLYSPAQDGMPMIRNVFGHVWLDDVPVWR